MVRKLLRTRRTRLFLALLGGSILLLHAFGYKIFGSATIYNNEVLVNPVRFTAIRPPCKLELASGETYSLAGVQLLPGVDWNEPIRSGSAPSLSDMIHASCPDLLADISRLPEGSVRASVKVRKVYWCGNTWFPCFFPERLPRYGRAELGEMLVNYGLARVVPCQDSPTDEYLASLLKCELEAKKLAAGRWSDPAILARFTDPDQLLNKLRQRFADWRNWSDTRNDIIESSRLLLRMGVPGVRDAMMDRIRDETDEVYLRTGFARELAMRNDLEGVDYLVNSLARPSATRPDIRTKADDDERARQAAILNELQTLTMRSGCDAPLRWEDQRQAMITWYREKRRNLRWLEREYRLGIAGENP